MSRARMLFVAVLVCALAAPALASDIPNSSFEDVQSDTEWVNSLSQWTDSPDVVEADMRVGNFFLNTYSATDGSKFAALTTNGLSAGANQAIRSGAFTIDTAQLQFDYVYITKNTPGDTTHTDPFTVVLDTSLGTFEYVVGSSASSGLTNGTIGGPPFAGGTTYDTGWRTYTVDTTSLMGATANLEFRVYDQASGGGVSGAFVDNISQVPEPGTLLLFGVGFLGLTAYGRRKLRARRK